MSKSTNGNIQVVLYDIDPPGPECAARVEWISHGDDMVGTNPVAVTHGRLCSRKQGCRWCTSLRDRIRSRTVR